MVRQDIKMDTKLENLWKLHASAWASFQRRADHEFRFSVVVWTAVVASIGLELKMDFLLRGWPLLLAAFFLIFLVGLHWWYESGMRQSNDTDLKKCYDLENTIMAIIGYSWSKGLQKNIDTHKEKCWIKKNWSHVGHVGITVVLALVVFSLLATKAPYPTQKAARLISSIRM